MTGGLLVYTACILRLCNLMFYRYYGHLICSSLCELQSPHNKLIWFTLFVDRIINERPNLQLFFVDSYLNLAVKLIFGTCDCGRCECSPFCFNAGKIRPMSSRGREIVIELWLV